MRTDLCLLAFLVAVTGFPASAWQSDNYPFAIESERSGDGHRIVARNNGPSPVSVKLSLVDNRNIAPDRLFPLFAVVPPGGGTLFLAQIRPALPGVGYSFSTQSSWVLGDFNARQSPDAVYRLPYREGETYRIGQAPGGPITTHTTAESDYAVDIGMPQDTPVLAARDGTVIYTEANQVYGGQSPDLMSKANVVRILHLDGTIATYAHLAHGGVYPYPGQRVMAGDPIGLAGSTGYSSGPHLHFAIQAIARHGDNLVVDSLPFKFYVGDPLSPFVPRYGMAVLANYTSSASAPGWGRAGDVAATPDTAKPAGVGSAPVAEGRRGLPITFAIPEPVRAWVSRIPLWAWLGAMVAIGVMLLRQANSAADRRRQEAYVHRRPRERSRSGQDDSS